MTQIIKDEALDLAREALLWANNEINSWRDYAFGYAPEDQLVIMSALTAIKRARSAHVQDSTCSETLRAQGKAYPRTCRKCGLGPCIGLANAAHSTTKGQP